MANESGKCKIPKLAEVWDRQNRELTRSSRNNTASRRLPHYMQPTEASLKRASKSNKSSKRPRKVSPAQPTISPLMTAPATSTSQDVTKVHLIKTLTLVDRTNHTNPRRKAYRGNKAKLKPMTPKLSEKRCRTPEGSVETSLSGKRRAKRQRVGEIENEIQNAGTDYVAPSTRQVTDPSPKRPKLSRKSFAAENTEFTFTQRLADQSLRSPSLPRISEIDADGSDGSDELSGTTPLEVISTAGRTPGVQRVNVTTSDRYEQVHSLRQQLLADKLKNATDTDSKLKILAQSPMIELTRKRPRRSTTTEAKVEFNDHEEAKPADSMEEAPSKATENVNNKIEKDVSYFKELVINNTLLLENKAAHWDEVNSSLAGVSEEVHGEIRTTACQARLIIAERFQQFSGLIANCEFKSGDRAVLVDDLEGFWDMIYRQVEDVLDKFRNLEKLQSSGWVMLESIEKKEIKVVKKTKAKPIKKTVTTSKFAAFKAEMAKKKRKPMNSPKLDQVLADSAGTEEPSTPSALPNEANVEQQVSPKTYQFRRRTVENLLASHEKAKLATPRGHLHKNVGLRSASNRKSSRKTNKSVQISLGEASARTPAATANVAQHRLSLAKSHPSIQPRRSCSPSAAMVGAMLSASKSGRASNLNSPLTTSDDRNADCSIMEYLLPTDETPLQSPAPSKKQRKSFADSLHKQALMKASGQRTPTFRLKELKLDETPEKEDAFVNDLVVFTPAPSPAHSTNSSLATPRRSHRIAKIRSRVSLL